MVAVLGLGQLGVASQVIESANVVNPVLIIKDTQLPMGLSRVQVVLERAMKGLFRLVIQPGLNVDFPGADVLILLFRRAAAGTTTGPGTRQKQSRQPSRAGPPAQPIESTQRIHRRDRNLPVRPPARHESAGSFRTGEKPISWSLSRRNLIVSTPVKPTAATDSPGRPLSRRDFLRNSSLAAAGAATAAHLPFGITAHAAADDPIRVGIIGCGGRGTGAVLNILGAATDVIYPAAGYHTEDAKPGTTATRKGIEVVALADVFPDRLASCRQNLQNLAEPIRILDDHCFTGFDAADRLLALPDVNYVILATPPYFRPAQLMAAVQSGKHVFMEKPVAVDAPGVRMVIAAGDLAKQKGLGIAAGTQRRHQRCYQETIRRLQDGMIGEIVEARAYWNGGEIWVIERKDGWTDMEWQLRNWNYFISVRILVPPNT